MIVGSRLLQKMTAIRKTSAEKKQAEGTKNKMIFLQLNLTCSTRRVTSYCNVHDQMRQCILPAESRCTDFIGEGEVLFGGDQTDTVTAKQEEKK